MSDEEEIKSSGVLKKVNSQVGVLRQQFEVEHELVNSYYDKKIPFEKILRRLPFTAVDHHWKYSDKYKNVDFIYFRKSDLDYTVYKFLSDIKRKNPKCKILFEIPTYPYKKENFHGLKDFPMYLKDLVTSGLMHRCVDRIVTFSKDEVIWGIPTIATQNGIDVSKIPVCHRLEPGNDIHVVEASSPAIWHGYDRFLTGLGEYYKNGGKRNIIFHMIGDGGETSNYRNIVAQYGISGHVIFHGRKFGEEFNRIYEKSYVGIDCLGRHRSGNSQNSSLKSREYAAFSLPIVSSVQLDFVDDDWKYVFYVPSDDSPVDINNFIEFYDSVYNGTNNITEIEASIRDVAERKCDMRATMKTVIDYIQRD